MEFSINNLLQHAKLPPLERMIRDSLWSVTYKAGDYFVKVFKCFSQDVENEISHSVELYNAGFPTPRCYGAYKYMDIHFTYFDYFEFQNVDIVLHFKEITDIILQLRNINLRSVNSDHWYKIIVPECENALCQLKFNTSKFYHTLHEMNPSIIVHGDLDISNLGMTENGIMIFDFQHLCVGDKDWDLANLISSSLRYNGFPLIENPRLKRIVQLLSAVKLGRAIRKNSSLIQSRKDFFEKSMLL